MELVEPFHLEQTSNPIQFRKRTFDFTEFFFMKQISDSQYTPYLYAIYTDFYTYNYYLFII